MFAVHRATPTADTLPRAHTDEHEGAPAVMLGRYLVLGLLGRGGMGVVYSGYDQQLRRRVALKRINRRGTDEHARERSLREALALARLAHPNIVTVYEAFEVDDELCIAMEFVAGKTLREWLAETRPSRDEVIAALLQAGRGIAAAHAAGLVHRDLKPDNIMRGDDGRVRVMDFGLALAVDERQDELEFACTGPSSPAPLVGRVTHTGTFVGTLGYTAPEQGLGLAPDARSDLFSFCVLAFEALHGVRPFVGDNGSDVLAATLAGRIVDAPDDKVPAWLDAVIRRGLAVEPDARWPTMDALLAALADDPLARARRRRRVLAWFVLAAFVVAGATYGVSLLREAVERSRREAAAATRLAAVEETIARAEAEGDQASAEAAFRAFITDPEHRRTRAHAQAWLDRGDRRTAVPAAARAAYAEAYVNATAVDDERDALQRLADTFVRDWNGVGLGRTAELLRDRGADDLALADLTVQAALWRGDLPTATTALARAGQQLVDWQPALQHLARATTSPTTVGDIELLSGDGPARFAVRDAAGTHVLLLDRALDEVGRWHDEGRIDLVPGTSWVLAQTATEARVVDLRTGAVLGRGAPDIATLAPFDATGDGVPELFFGRVWPRYGFERWDGLGRGETSVRGAHPGTDAGNSVVEAHAVGDLDGDGRDELALGFGPWRRFDLRVFRPDARGELELVAERRLGRIGGLALVHREGRPMLAVLVDNSSPAPEVFPEPPHTGGPPGLHLFEWANGTLVEADFIALPRSDDFGRFTAHDREAVGDLDGDGREDLAFPLDRAGQPWLLLLRQTATSFEPLLVAGIELFAGAQLDDDAPIELLAALPPERRLLALGLGDAPPLTSRHDEPELPAVPPPLLADPWLVERWQRANDLTALALFDSAAESLRDAALMTADRPARSALLDRAGALFAGQDRMADVLALADDVHDDWQVRSRVQLRRTQALSRLGRHADALASAEALLRAPERDAESARHAAALADELSALLDPATQIDLRFDVPLAPGWRIHTPGALSRKRTRGVLELAIPALDTAVAELPIDWRGGPISLEFELDVDRIEFGAGIEISLVDADGARWLGAALSGQGGGGRLRQVMWVRAGGTSWVELSGHAVASGLHRRRLAVRLTYFPAAAAANLMLANDDDVRLARLAVAAPPSPGLHRLRIGAFADSKMSSLATGELRRLVIRGAALGVAGDDASDRAARLLAEHEPRAALATLDQDASSDPRADMLRLLALADLADLAGLADAIPAVLAHADDPTHRGELVLALRRHPLAGAALRDAAGPALLPALWATWAFARPHRNDLLQRDELLDGLREIDRLAPRTDAERDALRELLETRARLWERAELPERARQDRELAAALARSMSTSTHSPGVLTTSSSRD